MPRTLQEGVISPHDIRYNILQTEVAGIAAGCPKLQSASRTLGEGSDRVMVLNDRFIYRD